MCCHWTMCQIIIWQCVQLSLDNVSNNYVNVRQDFFALAIICPIFFHLNLILSNQMWFVWHRRCQRCQLSAPLDASWLQFHWPYSQLLSMVKNPMHVYFCPKRPVQYGEQFHQPFLLHTLAKLPTLTPDKSHNQNLVGWYYNHTKQMCIACAAKHTSCTAKSIEFAAKNTCVIFEFF